jgi:DNA-binding GntR family transcriptional regulator
MIQEHDSYLEALKKRDGEMLSNLLSNNLDYRSKHIPYENSAYFESNDK